MRVFFRREGVFLIVLFFFALGLRLVYLGELRSSPLFDAPIVDARYHDDWAQAICDGETFREGPYFRAPLYPYFLAAIYTIFGHSYLIVRIIQFLIGSGSCLLIYFLGKRVFNPTVGRVAAVLASVYGTFIYFEGELLIPVLILFLNLALILAVLSAQERPGWWRWLGCGAILGLSAIARPNVLLFGVVLLLWIFLRMRRRGLRRVVVYLVAFCLGVLLVILPVTVRNYVVSKDFVPIASQGGVNFFIGNNRDSDGATAIVPGTRASWWGGYYDVIQLAEEAEGRPLKASEVSNYWFNRGVEFVRDEPGAFLRLTIRKLVLFWGAAEISNNKDIYFFSERTPVLGVLLWPGIVFCPFGIVAPLALAGMVLAWRRREAGEKGRKRRRGKGKELLVLFVFTYMVSIILFFVTARYRLPVIPFLLPFAAYCLVCLFRERRRAAILLSVGLILFFGLVVNLRLTGDPFPTQAESYTSLGNVYMAKEMYDQAEEEFRQALAIDPSWSRAVAGLARMYDATDMVDEAIEHWQQVISISPGMAESHFHLGFSYYARGDLDEAIAQWLETVRLQPELAQPYLQLGNAYQDKGQYEDAIANFKQAVSVNPRYVIANYNLGHLYKELGRIDEAVEQFKQAFGINSNFADAYNSLAWLYSQEGINLDEGIELIKKALQLDESSAAYWDTLAELYIRKGELDRAAEIFRQMIQREPQETFWKQRLEQVGG